MSALIAWLLKDGWKMLGIALVAASLAYEIGHWRGYDAGYAAHEAEAVRKIMEKLDEAGRADEAMRKCLSDPACRLQDDGFKRPD